MPAAFLHGVETITLDRSPRPVQQARSAVIGVVGIAPAGPVNQPTLLLSPADAAQFGKAYAGFSLPQALEDIFASGAATVIAVNVADPALTAHKTTIASELATMDVSGQVKTTKPAISALTVKGQSGTPTYVLDTDYTVDLASGTITRKAGGAIAAGATVQLGFAYLDPIKPTAADIIGTVDVNGVRSGLKVLYNTFNLYGFDAKILIAPGYASTATVSAELINLANALDAVAYVAAPVGTTYTQAIAGRGPSGTINFYTSSDRVRLFYPHVSLFNSMTGGTRMTGMDAVAAGMRAALDVREGFHWDLSNNEIPGVLGLERVLTARYNDPQSETNLLNASGITTVFASYGTGYRIWGTRNASFPASSGLRTFEAVRRTQIAIDESIRYSGAQYLGRPINQGLIDAIVESVNGYGRVLIQREALLGFLAWYDPARNTAATLANGQLIISYKFTPPPPLERLTFESELTSEYMINLRAA